MAVQVYLQLLIGDLLPCRLSALDVASRQIAVVERASNVTQVNLNYLFYTAKNVNYWDV